MSRNLRFAFVSVPLLVGCATSDNNADLSDVAPVRKFDSANIDTSSNTDTSVNDSDTSVSDSGGPCIPLTSEQKPCGRCGKQTRVCSTSGTWSEFSACSGELTSTTCTIGETQNSPCGNCGKQIDTCDTETCEWVTGSCSGEGACAEGETEESSASCSVVGEVRTRTCSDKCAWGGYSDCSLPKGWVSMASAPSGFEARGGHTSVWTGTDMIVWGGYSSTYTSPTYCKRNGAMYNLAGNSWKTIALPPTAITARYYHSAVWSGSKMIVWGGNDYSAGYRADGAIYDPVGDTWTALPTTALAARYGHRAVWSTTTNEMLVWGGYGSCTGTYCGDGAAYDPALNTWTAIPAAPIAARWNHVAIWTGSELVIWGGQGTTGYLRDGARYDPKTKVWTKFPDPPVELDGRYESSAAWNGKEVLVWGGYGTYVSPTYGRSDGGRYLPGGSWSRFNVPMTDIFATGTVATRFAAQAWSAGGKLYLWSGGNGSSSTGTALAGGVAYDPSLDKWTTMPTTGAPTSRVRASVAWTGKEAIIWGGASYASLSYSTTYYADGVIFRP